MNSRQIAWTCGMAVGVVFGALIAMASFPWSILAFAGWLFVLVGYVYDYSRIR